MIRSKDKRVFDIFAKLVLTLLALLCLTPFWFLVCASLSQNSEVMKYGFSFWPRSFTLEAYRLVFKVPGQILGAYKVSIIVTATGTLLTTFLSSMTGYVFSRRDYPFRNAVSLYMYLPSLFGAGLVPYYILCVKFLKFKQHPYLALIIGGIFGYFYAIIFRGFVTSNIPDSVTESAKIDGANDFTIYLRLIVPMAKPVLATIALFSALNYWNDWFTSLLFITDEKYYPLQYYLYKAVNNMTAIKNTSAVLQMPIRDLPSETFKYATTMVTIGPILLLYPFLQKYFIKGITIGAVKG